MQWAKHSGDYILCATIDFVSYFTAQWLVQGLTDVDIGTTFLCKHKIYRKLHLLHCVHIYLPPASDFEKMINIFYFWMMSWYFYGDIKRFWQNF